MTRKRLMVSVALGVLMLAPAIGYCQRWATVGLFIRTGLSSGINSPNAPVNQQVGSYTYPSVGVGLYSFVPLTRSDSARTIFRQLRIEYATLSTRSGAFDVGNGTIARLEVRSTDVSVALPVAANVSREVQFYALIGLNAGYTFRSTITPSSASPGVDTGSSFRTALINELGFKFGYASFIGFRAHYEFGGKYPIGETSMIVGYSPLRRVKTK